MAIGKGFSTAPPFGFSPRAGSTTSPRSSGPTIARPPTASCAYLHALRDRLPVDEAAQLGAQLPELIRGIYYEGWDPSRTPVRYAGFSDVLSRVSSAALLGGEPEASFAVGAAATVLRRHVSAGEIEDVLAILPEDLRPILA